MRLMLSALSLTVLISCSTGTDTADSTQTASVDIRQKWIEALADSVSDLQAKYDANIEQSEQCKNDFGNLLTRFVIVTDPLLVEQYRVVDGWKNYDTTGKQGLLARVLENGTIEIVATCTPDFNSITLSSGGDIIHSEQVPSSGDALHTSIGSLTRVAFNNASPLAEFVYSHSGQPITLTFSNGKEFTLSQAQKDMLADTYQFSQKERELTELDKQQTVIYNKLMLCKAKLDELQKQQ